MNWNDEMMKWNDGNDDIMEIMEMTKWWNWWKWWKWWNDGMLEMVDIYIVCSMYFSSSLGHNI